MLNTIVGAGAVGAGAASRYGSGSGSDQKMRLLAAPAPQHWYCVLIESAKKKLQINVLQTILPYTVYLRTLFFVFILSKLANC
jgi:hypothetical protein